MMTRRKLVIALGAGAFAPLASFAQQSNKVFRIGFLSEGTPEAGGGKNLAIMVARLTELGWKEGVNLNLDINWGQNDPERYRKLATALAAKKPALLVVPRDTEAKIALPLMGSVPILFASGFDPIGSGLVKSLARPGGTVTGISSQNRELSPKRLGLLKEVVPRLTRVGALYRAGDANALHWLEVSTAQGKARGMQVIPAPVGRREDLASAFESMAKQMAGAVMNIADRLFFETRRELAELSLKHGMASIGGVPEFADAGALLSYAPDASAAWRQIAGFVDRVLKGANPADMPV